MPGLGPRLIVAAYAIGVLGLLLWQSLRGLARVRAVVDYLDLRERTHPESCDWKAPPIAKQAALPPSTLALILAGLALVPVLTGIALGRPATWQIALAALAVLAAAVVVVSARRSPWSETRSLVWSAANAEGETRETLLRRALDMDPQVSEAAVPGRSAQG
jgi:hypothetical protein